MNKKNTVVIVIPIYKSQMSAEELLSLQQCIKVLHNYPIIFLGSSQLNVDEYQNACKNKIQFNMEYFEERYFKDIAGYNSLMLSVHFYERFINYKYILLYQLDAWIFQDDLIKWCNKNYDYIGAPWVNWEWSEFAAGHISFFRTILSKLGYRKFNLVGNGGLSLRKVRSTIFNLKLFKYKVLNFTENEDYFFSYYINSYNPFFNIPEVKEALNFSFDENPEQSLELNKGELPMGCHAWPKYKYFWNKYII